MASALTPRPTPMDVVRSAWLAAASAPPALRKPTPGIELTPEEVEERRQMRMAAIPEDQRPEDQRAQPPPASAPPVNPFGPPACLLPPMMTRQRAVGCDEDDGEVSPLPETPRRQAGGEPSRREHLAERRGRWLRLLTEIRNHINLAPIEALGYQLTDAAAIHTVAQEMRDTGEVSELNTVLINTLDQYADPANRPSSELRYATLTHIIRLLETEAVFI